VSSLANLIDKAATGAACRLTKACVLSRGRPARTRSRGARAADAALSGDVVTYVIDTTITTRTSATSTARSARSSGPRSTKRATR